MGVFSVVSFGSDSIPRGCAGITAHRCDPFGLRFLYPCDGCRALGVAFGIMWRVRRVIIWRKLPAAALPAVLLR
jgi:hypothetical protein